VKFSSKNQKHFKECRSCGALDKIEKKREISLVICEVISTFAALPLRRSKVKGQRIK
jgi:hypothetical protein